MCALAMLGLHEDLKAIDIQHKIEQSNLSQASYFVYLPIMICKKQTEQFKLNDIPTLEEAKELLCSDLFQGQEHYSLRGCFMELLQKWLDLVYVYESSKRIKDDQLIEEVQQIGLQILKDKLNIQRFWEKGNLKMF